MKKLTSYRIVFGVAVSTPCGDQMYDPPEHTGRADPRKTREDEPDDPDNDPAVVYLTDSGYQQTQNSSNQGFTHRSKYLRIPFTPAGSDCSQNLRHSPAIRDTRK